jgi:hypothetical protein
VLADAREELLEHLQAPAARGGHAFADQPIHRIADELGGDLTTLHDTDHLHLAHALGHRHPQRDPVREAEQAYDRLNPEFGVPADTHNPDGRQAVRDREAALTLGVRVAIHNSRQNDRAPVIWQPGQDYQMADAIQTARRELVRARHGPERTGPQR